MASKSKKGASRTTQSKKSLTTRKSSGKAKKSGSKKSAQPKSTKAKKAPQKSKEAPVKQSPKAPAKQKENKLFTLGGELTVTSIPVVLKGGGKRERFVTPEAATDEKGNVFSKSVIEVSVDGAKTYIMKLDAEQTWLLLMLLGLVDA